MTNREFPFVIACLPVWNAGAFIVQTLDCLVAQNYRNLKILISDDCSGDNTVAICEEYLKKHDRFHLLQQKRNLGWIGNVNFLLKESEKYNPDYLFFAAHDDIIDSDYVSSLVEELENNPRAILAFSDMETNTDRDGTHYFNTYTQLEGVGDRGDRAKIIIEQHGDWWTCYRGVFRAEAAKKIKGLKKHFAGEFAADLPWLLHLSLLGEFVRVPRLLYHKRYQSLSISHTWSYGYYNWMCVTLSCAREIRNADLLLQEELPLQILISRRFIGLVREYFKSRIVSLKGKIRSRLKPKIEFFLQKKGS